MSFKSKEEQRVYYRKNADKMKLSVTKWKRANPDLIKAYKAKYRANPVHKYDKYKYAAGYKGRSFELDFEFFNYLLNQKCHYCGIKNSNGIDRVDSNFGYTKENVVPCCKICNIMKMSLTYDSFLKYISKIYKNLLLK